MTQLPIGGPLGATLPSAGGGTAGPATRWVAGGCGAGGGGAAAVKPASGAALAVARRGVLSGMTRPGSKLAEV